MNIYHVMDRNNDKPNKEDVDAKNKQVQSAGPEKDEEETDQSADSKDKLLQLSKKVNEMDNKHNKEIGKMKEQLQECTSSVKNLKTDFENYGKDQKSKRRIKEEQFSKEESARSTRKKSGNRETPVISRPLDGRLITIDKKQIDALIKNREHEVLKGGFGDVFISKSEVPDLDVRMVIKRITCEGNDRIKKLSALNEKIAARVMHFAIVPLIAYAEKQLECAKRAYYFLSPYLENRSLLELIARDKNCSSINDVMLKWGSRIQILFQIASAIDYIHTPVSGYRGIILHMDVTTKNIVLDQHLNARLIDFGLAREMNEGQQKVSLTQSKSFGTPGYYPTKSYSSLTVHEDYHNFGVVIRELLTGEAPYIENENGNEASQLRKSGEVVIKRTLQKLIWPDGNKFVPTLLQLSGRCLKNREDKSITSACIVEELKEILIMINYQWTRPEADNCDLCMVNVAVEDEKAPPHRCKMKICVSCMRNSHINPIRCPTCNEKVTPEIGHTFAALLIAGNDIKKPALAESFRREINEIKNVLASKYPCVIGISEEDIKTITPSNPGSKEILLPKVSSAFEFFQERKNIGTLLIYFSGHNSSATGFVLGSPDDVLPIAKLQEYLMKLCKSLKQKARILVFLDCCEPPFMNPDPDLLKAGVKIIQINACRKSESSTQPLSGSIFQKFFVQALTRKIYNKQCYGVKAISGKLNKCENCTMLGDFISGEQLLKYISNHMKMFYNSKKPVLSMHDVSSLDVIIGYNVDFAVDLRLKFEVHSQEAKDVKLDQEMHSDIDELKLRILQKMMCQEDVKLKLTDKFADVISLRIHTGSENGKELTTMLQVYAAMNTNMDSIASCRSVSNIGNGRVAMFTPTTSLYQYFSEKKFLESTVGGRKEAIMSWIEFDEVIDGIGDKKDLESFLITVLKAWDKETNKEGKELKVIFPCTKTENGNDFVVLDLSEKAEGASSALTNERTQS